MPLAGPGYQRVATGDGPQHVVEDYTQLAQLAARFRQGIFDKKSQRGHSHKKMDKSNRICPFKR